MHIYVGSFWGELVNLFKERGFCLVGIKIDENIWIIYFVGDCNRNFATMFDETARTYLPKLMTEFYEDLRKKYPTDNETGIASRCKGIVESSVSVVIELLCERNEMTLYKNGRAEEANKLLAQLLEEKIERHRKNAKQQ